MLTELCGKESIMFGFPVFEEERKCSTNVLEFIKETIGYIEMKTICIQFVAYELRKLLRTQEPFFIVFCKFCKIYTFAESGTVRSLKNPMYEKFCFVSTPVWFSCMRRKGKSFCMYLYLVNICSHYWVCYQKWNLKLL